jgi:hypothetical protein
MRKKSTASKIKHLMFFPFSLLIEATIERNRQKKRKEKDCLMLTHTLKEKIVCLKHVMDKNI